MQVDRITGVSKIALILVLGAVSSATLSVIFHSRIHPLSEMFLIFSLGFGFFASVKMLNSIAIHLPRLLEVFIHWIHAMTFEALALITLPFLRLFAQRRTPTGTGRPILLVHGYCNDGSVWTYMKWHLSQKNLGRIYTINLGHPFRSIKEYAAKLQLKAAEIRRETDRSDLILIGHSMGGLVSSFYATDLAPPKTVKKIITIGTPLAGTYMAKMGVGPNAKEMIPASAFIANLNRKIASDNFTRYYHIATNTDQIIIPSNSALLKKDPSREFFFEDMGHVSMLFSPRVGALLASWLRE